MKRNQGVTLIELMVTISIAVILMTVAVPGLQQFMTSNRLSGIATDMISSLNLAKSEAIKRGLNVYLCTGNACTGCTGGDCINDWSGGWIVYVDVNSNGSYNSSGANPDTLLKRYPKLTSTQYTLNDQGFATQVQYMRNGAANATSTSLFAICHDNNTTSGITINVSPTGPRLATGVADCTP